MEEELSSLLHAAVSRGVTPGLAAAIATVGPQSSAISLGAGWLARDHQQKANVDTIYDLSSLTKVFSTTILSAIAIERGLISLKEQPWPQWPGVTIAHILSHHSGLAAHQKFFRLIDRREIGSPQAKKAIVQAVLNSTLQYPAGQHHIYSDLGFIALGDLLERRFGASLDQLFSSLVGKYIPIGEMHYQAVVRPQRSGLYAPTAPGFFGAAIKRGLVDDDNCYAMGGVAGHAGLFANLNDALRAAIFLAEKMLYSNEKLFLILRRFSENQPHPLGFDRVSRGGSTGGSLSANSFGHLGFTGTSLWFDLDYNKKRGVVYLLLSNRIHLKSSAKKMLSLRQDFHREGAKWALSCWKKN